MATPRFAPSAFAPARGCERALRPRRLLRSLGVSCAALCPLLAAAPLGAAIPSGFERQVLATGLDSPTALVTLRDGRALVTLQNGRVLAVREGSPAVEILQVADVDDAGERGLLGIAVEPSLSGAGWIYLYYTRGAETTHNRLARYWLDGDTVVGGESIVYDWPPIGNAIWHMGGALAFGGDGLLYVGVGDHQRSDRAKSLSSAFGKIHRLTPDGGVPSDNPFVDVVGALPTIWAFGLRNPYDLTLDPESGALLINDVGDATWEEINLGGGGADYGWPASEGMAVSAGETAPVYAYTHSGGACAITGGAFAPSTALGLPEAYRRKYFFADFCAGWMRYLDPQTGAIATFATDLDFPTAVEIDAQSRILYLSRGSAEPGAGAEGELVRLESALDPALLPQITAQPADAVAAVGESASFRVEATGQTSLQWLRNGVALPGATGAELELDAVVAGDGGARFQARLANAYGSVATREAILVLTDDRRPVPEILAPAVGSLFDPGGTLAFSGTANDPEEGALAPARLSWRIDFRHDDHAHPFFPETAGIASGAVAIPAGAHGPGLTWFEVRLTAVDAEGRSATATRAVFPRAAVEGTLDGVLPLAGSRFLAAATFVDPRSGGSSPARALPIADHTGAFWFFDSTNGELLLKVLDGRPLNGHFWIFGGSLSNLEFELSVVDSHSGALWTLLNPAGSMASWGDTSALPDPGEPDAGAGAAPAAPPLANPAVDALTLHGGRFVVTLDWANPRNGETGTGHPVALSEETGWFWFFDPTNLELAVKILDGRGVNGSFWVYFTGLTDLELALRIRDQVTGIERVYAKPPGAFDARSEIDGFPSP